MNTGCAINSQRNNNINIMSFQRRKLWDLGIVLMIVMVMIMIMIMMMWDFIF
ncbi:hypothetical protein HanPSC8_Chr06g0238291 [Helianthus annuus]|nr:hypothetical protein HanPSC8_Chr06g0238291 [Helianthus annuus]